MGPAARTKKNNNNNKVGVALASLGCLVLLSQVLSPFYALVGFFAFIVSIIYIC